MNGFTKKSIHRPLQVVGILGLQHRGMLWWVTVSNSHTQSRPVTSVLSGPIDNPVRDCMGIFSTTLPSFPTKACPPLFIISLVSLINRLTVSSMTHHNQSNPPSSSVKKIPAELSCSLKKCQAKMWAFLIFIEEPFRNADMVFLCEICSFYIVF